MSNRTGTVHTLWRWPVKGMMGERVMSVRVDTRGVGGDRTHAVLCADGTPLSERDAEALEEWRAAYPFNVGANVDPASPPHALVTAPGLRSFVWDDPRLRHALRDALGHPVRLARSVAGQQLVERTVLVTWGEADPAQARANVHLELDEGLDPQTDAGTLDFDGGVRMRILRPCPRGGVYARVLSNGRVAVGAGVRLAGLAAGTSGSGAIGR
jgi:uncharacterized protein YcbX